MGKPQKWKQCLKGLEESKRGSVVDVVDVEVDDVDVEEDVVDVEENVRDMEDVEMVEVVGGLRFSEIGFVCGGGQKQRAR